MWRWLLTLSVFSILVFGCSGAPSDETPSGSVRLFLEALDRSQVDARALDEAYALLASESRRGLRERAHLASSLGAREMRPSEMIVQGRSRRLFSPGVGAAGLEEEIDGERAIVRVRSEDGRRSAEVPLVRESGRWRIVLELPPARRRGVGDTGDEASAERDAEAGEASSTDETSSPTEGESELLE